MQCCKFDVVAAGEALVIAVGLVIPILFLAACMFDTVAGWRKRYRRWRHRPRLPRARIHRG